MEKEELTSQHLFRRAASFRLHLIYEFGQLPEQVQAEYTPLTYSQGPRLKQVFHPEWSSSQHVRQLLENSVGVSQNLQLQYMKDKGIKQGMLWIYVMHLNHLAKSIHFYKILKHFGPQTLISYWVRNKKRLTETCVSTVNADFKEIR